MKYVINIENPTPDVLRQIWFSKMQEDQGLKGTLPEPTSRNGGDMKVFISVADAAPNLIAGIGKVLTYIESGVKPVESKPVVHKSATKEPLIRKKHVWSKKALDGIKMVSMDAPWGLKLDGTPRKRPGGAPNKYKKLEVTRITPKLQLELDEYINKLAKENK
jgi:hypothetical protein